MTNRALSHHNGVRPLARYALWATIATAVASVNGAAAAIESPDGTIGIIVQPPEGDPERIEPEVNRWGRLLCRARFPLSAKKCRDYKISDALVETTVTESTPLTVVAWIDERKLAEAVGEQPPDGYTAFVMPICAKTRIAFPGEVIAETKADVRTACRNASAVDDAGLKGDALSMARLRLIREVVVTQIAQDDPDAAIGPDEDLMENQPAPVKKLEPLKARRVERRQPKPADLPDFPGDAFVPRSLLRELE